MGIGQTRAAKTRVTFKLLLSNESPSRRLEKSMCTPKEFSKDGADGFQK